LLPLRKGQADIKMYCRKMNLSVDWIFLSQDCVHIVMNVRFHIVAFLDTAEERFLTVELCAE